MTYDPVCALESTWAEKNSNLPRRDDSQVGGPGEALALLFGLDQAPMSGAAELFEF